MGGGVQEAPTTVEAIRRRKHSNTVLWTVDPEVQEKPGVGQKALGVEGQSHGACGQTPTQARRARVSSGEAGRRTERWERAGAGVLEAQPSRGWAGWLI